MKEGKTVLITMSPVLFLVPDFGARCLGGGYAGEGSHEWLQNLGFRI